MSTEFDIELIFEHKPQFEFEEVSIQLDNSYEIYYEDEKKQIFSIAFADNDKFTSGKTLEGVIIFFLEGLIPFKEMFTGLNSSIRIGVFYDLNDTVVFPVVLSHQCIKLLDEFGVRIDITGYPCAEEEE